MRVFDYLNQLATAGELIPLYRANVVTAKAYNYRELMLYYSALAALPKFADDPRECAERTARDCKVDLSTVYRAVRAMSREFEVKPERLAA